jgi:hypothetical protein
MRRDAWFRFLLCCGAGIFGVRAFIVERFGASIPQVDEWQATGQEILLPWRNGSLGFAALFEAHNGDHRIVATRLWEIFWYAVNGAWDPKLIMITKAAVFAAAATVFIHLLAGALPRRRFIAGAVLAVLFAFPFSFHNLFWAFQSQFDFFLLAVALGWLALRSDRPAAALAIASLSLLTLGAGPILAASYLPFALGSWWDRRWSLRRTVLFSASALALLAVGVSLRGAHAAPVGPLRDQAAALATLLGWPHSGLVSIVDRLPESARLIPAPLLNFPQADNSWLLRTAEWLHAHPAVVPSIDVVCALLLLAPTAVLAVLVALRRVRGVAAWGPLGLAGFAFLMQVATAIARSQEPGVVAVRYLDLVALSGLAAMASAFFLSVAGRRWRPLVVAWTLLTLPSCLAMMVGTAAQIKQRRPQLWLANVQEYFPSHDPAIFDRMIAANANWPLPFISRDIAHLVQMLDDPALAAVLPRSVVAPAEPPRPAARLASIVAGNGIGIVVVAIGAGTWIAWRSRRRLGFAPGNHLASSTSTVGG